MITQLRIKNFRSLRNLNIALGPLTVLVGPNMGGKSNLADAFYFIQQLFFPQPGVEGLVYAMAQRGGIGEVLWKGGNESLIGFYLDGISEGTTDRTWSYVLEIVAGTAGFAQIQKESFVVRDGDAAAELIIQEGSSRWLVNKDGQKLVSNSGITRSAVQNAPDSWDGADFAKSVGSWKFYQLIPQLMRQANPTGSGFVLARHGENLSAWLMNLQTRFLPAFLRVSEGARDSFPELEELRTWPTAQGTVFLSSSERGLKLPIGVGGMSDGELCFLALLSLIYAPAEFGAALYCIEEPENHLHPRLVSTLVKLTRQVREELIAAGAPLAQMVLTTQSPLLIDEMSIDEVVWIDKRDGETRAIRPGSQDHLRQLVADKELGLGDIVYSGLLGEPK